MALLPAWALLLATLVGGDDPDDDFFDLSLEELMEVEVTTAGRGSQSLEETAAAVHVITRDDIRRSGMRSVPELLRLVPGVQVARIGTSSWAISIRGFNGRFANKLLVMIDGRTVYSGLFSGVYWHAQDLLLEDIERIEVIRGPGGSLWGANAVNGIIHVITRSSHDTVGALAYGSVGDERKAETGARYGGTFGEDGSWRLYAKWFDDDTSQRASGSQADDQHHQWRTGFRADWNPTPDDQVMLQWEAFAARARGESPVFLDAPPFFTTLRGTSERNGGDLMVRWSRVLGDGSDFQVQGFYAMADSHGEVLADRRNVLEFDFQHGLQAGRHRFLWGTTFRQIDSDTRGASGLSFSQRHRTDRLLGAFVQDSITLIEDELELTVGAKLEHNEFTDEEFQPSIRVGWQPGEDQTVWASVSRAVRTPSVVNDDISLVVSSIPGAPPTIVRLQGNEDLEAEDLTAYEVGYRTRLTESASLDITAFYFDYDNLNTVETGTPFFDGTNTIVPQTFQNLADAKAYGLEVAGVYAVRQGWRLTANVSLLELDVDRKAGSNDPVIESTGQGAPGFQAGLRSSLDVTESIDFDIGLYGVEGLQAQGTRGYLRVDSRLAWRPRDGLEVALVLQNATDPSHREYSERFVSSVSEIERSAFLSITWGK